MIRPAHPGAAAILIAATALLGCYRSVDSAGDSNLGDAPQCDGRGDVLAECLDLLGMYEGPDPEDSAFLAKCCRSGGIDFAHPGRRFVRLAQLWGAGAYVDSICKPDWGQAMENIATLVVDRLAPTE